MKRQILGVMAAVLGLVGLMTVFGSFYTLDETERGVKTRMGVIVGTIEPGFGLKAPFIEDVTIYDIKVQKVEFEDVAALSKDLQRAEIDVAVNLQIDPAGVTELYKQTGRDYENRIVNPAVYDVAKATFGKFTSAESVKDWDKMANAMSEHLSTELKPYGIVVRTVQIQNVTFGDEFLHAIEERMKAEVEVQKVHQNLEREKVEADIKRTQADASAYQTLATAKAEAEGIQLRGSALRANQELVELTKAEKWNGVLPTTMVPGNAVPFLDVTPTK
jgi:regulator of protease activity HflC (stomatin/prohibitin superfamily)